MDRGQGNAIGADAKEHGMGKTDDTAVTQEQIITGHQHDKDADPGSGINSAHAGKQKWCQCQTDQNAAEDQRQWQGTRHIAREKRADHFAFTTGIMPIGRHIRMVTIRAILEMRAALGSIKAM